MFNNLKLPLNHLHNTRILLFKFKANSNKNKNLINHNLILNTLDKKKNYIHNYFKIENIIQNNLKHASNKEINLNLKLLPI